MKFGERSGVYTWGTCEELGIFLLEVKVLGSVDVSFILVPLYLLPADRQKDRQTERFCLQMQVNGKSHNHAATSH